MKKPYLTALIFTDEKVTNKLKKKLSLQINKINSYLPSYEKICKFKLLSAEELKKSKLMKLSRKKVIGDHLKLFEEMYKEN